MAQSLLYRLFGFGKIPEPLKMQLESEGIELLAEGLSGSVTYRNFRAPGRRVAWKRQYMIGSIVLTDERLVGLGYSKYIINIPLTDQRICSLKFLEKPNNALVVTFDANLFHDDWSGIIEFRFRTEQAKDFLDKLSGIQHNFKTEK